MDRCRGFCGLGASASLAPQLNHLEAHLCSARRDDGKSRSIIINCNVLPDSSVPQLNQHRDDWAVRQDSIHLPVRFGRSRPFLRNRKSLSHNLSSALWHDQFEADLSRPSEYRDYLLIPSPSSMSKVPSGLWQNLVALQVYGANTNVGKTVFSTLLGAHFSRRGGVSQWRVHYIKPVSTGPLSDADDEYVVGSFQTRWASDLWLGM